MTTFNKFTRIFKLISPTSHLCEQHDTLVSILLAGLQINNKLPPPFGSTVIFELHQHNESDPEWDNGSSIKILYLNETE